MLHTRAKALYPTDIENVGDMGVKNMPVVDIIHTQRVGYLEYEKAKIVKLRERLEAEEAALEKHKTESSVGSVASSDVSAHIVPVMPQLTCLKLQAMNATAAELAKNIAVLRKTLQRETRTFDDE